MTRLPAYIAILFILAGGVAACKDDPVTSKPQIECDTCDTTDTVIVSPNDTTSHDFTWTEYTIPAEASISGCWVFDDTTIWAISNKLYMFSKGGWTHKPLKNQAGEDMNEGLSGSSLFGFTPNDTWIIYSGILWHYRNDTAYEYRLNRPPYDIPLEGPFRAAWGTSSNDMFFVGDKGTIVHFDGTNWMKFPTVTEKNLRSVWGTTSNDVWVSGFTSQTAETILLHYNGASWTEVDVSRKDGINATGGFNWVWTVDSAGHKITMTAGAILIKQTDNGPWRSDSGLVTNRLSDGSFAGLHKIYGNSANDVMLQGAGGWIGHWNGRSWHQYTQLFNWGNPSYSMFGSHFKDNTAVMVGQKGSGFAAIGRRVK